MIACAAPAEWVQAAPVDPAALYAQAQADRAAGRNAEAVDTLRRVLALRPGDVDARVALGFALLALDRLDEADAAFDQALAEAPAYADAEIGKARIAQRRGDRAQARSRIERALRIDPGRADAQAVLAALDAPRWRIDVDLSHSRLSGGVEDWSEQRIGAARQLGDAWTVAGAVERTRRFGDVDVYLEARIARRFAEGSAYAAVGRAPDADYRPEAAVLAGGERTFGAVGVTLDGSLARYRAGTVSSLQPGLLWRDPGGRLELAARWINVWDEADVRRQGYAVRGLLAFDDRTRFRLGYADAPETSEGVTVDVRGFSVGLERDLTDRLSARVNLIDEDRGALDREEVSLGLGWRF
jgi:YaiO family outer membrane protein